MSLRSLSRSFIVRGALSIPAFTMVGCRTQPYDLIVTDGGAPSRDGARSDGFLGLECAPVPRSCRRALVDLNKPMAQNGALDSVTGKIYFQMTDIIIYGDGSGLYTVEFPEGIPFDAKSHRVVFPFFGENYVISNMANETVVLGKETIAGKIMVGQSLPASYCYEFKVQDTYSQPSGDKVVIISVFNGPQPFNVEIEEGGTMNINPNPPQNRNYITHVYEINAKEKWVEMAVLSEELRIVHGQNMTVNSSSVPGFASTVTTKSGHLMSFSIRFPANPVQYDVCD